jgi:hypothetical protein
MLTICSRKMQKGGEGMSTEQGLFGELPPLERRKNLKKFERMWALYGKREDKKCGDCQHMITKYGDVPAAYFKCKFYGDSSSEATDWRRKYTACGLFKECDDSP